MKKILFHHGARLFETFGVVVERGGLCRWCLSTQYRRSLGNTQTPCTADDGSPGYWPAGCSHMAIEERMGGSDVNCTCIPRLPKAQTRESCSLGDGSRGFWPTGCQNMGIEPRFGCSCVKLAECRSNTHYCVYKGDCAVPTYKLRRDNCPLKDLECCPKPSTKEQITPYIGDWAKDVVPSFEATTAPSADRASEVSTKPAIKVTKSTTAVYSSTTEYPMEANESSENQVPSSNNQLRPSTTANSVDSFEEPLPSSTDNQLPLSTTASIGDSVESLASSTDNQQPSLSIANSEESFEEPLPSSTDNQLPTSSTASTVASVEKPSIKPMNVLPPVVVPASNITADDIAPLSENFVYTLCGQRAKNGLIPQKMRDQQDRAEYGEIPWMVAVFQMLTNDDGTPSFRYCCNGALISDRAVLTTAHCVSICGGKVESILVRLGEWDLNSTIEAIPPTEAQVLKAHKHKDFAINSLINNIAVLELASIVQYGPTIQPVCLPEKHYSLTSRENLIFTGWGKTVQPTLSSNGHNFLKAVILRNNERSICKGEMKSYDSSHRLELHSSFVCGTKVNEEQPCRGDAGAPVVAEVPYSEDRYYIHGLVSWGYECSRPDRPNTALTDVQRFRPWITKTLANIAKASNSGTK
ncbi:hypothetical protein AND_002518 [Anopheles darlingi]|uniref:Peptidase S1 domain-containing protein n=1 Tax=Anopheles darlingi TaxID=43151 RepID=W5JS04_ANODA|nr:hypothetical protein AND_002518 [Anopheles darlingi]